MSRMNFSYEALRPPSSQPLDQRARDRHRRHGAGEGERRDDADLPGGGEVDQALAHRDVENERRVGVDDGIRVRPRLERGFVEVVAQAQDLERVRDLARPAGIDEGRLVGIQHLDPHHPQVAQVGRDVLGLHRGPGHVDHVERLGEADEVSEVLEGARALAAGGVHGVGRTADGDELGVAAADRERAVAAGQGELRRRRGNRRLHHLPPEPDLPAGDGRAGAPQEFAGAVVVDLDAQLLEHGERGGMDVGNLIVGIALGQRQGTRQPAVID